MPAIVEALAAAGDDERAALVEKYQSKLKAHYARIYLSDPVDDVRKRLDAAFLGLDAALRSKLLTAFSEALAKATAHSERARALRGIAKIAHTHRMAVPAPLVIEHAASPNAAVRAMALRCMWLLPARQVTDAVRKAFTRGLVDANKAVRQEALAALHNAAVGYIYVTKDKSLPTFRAICGPVPDKTLLDALASFIRSDNDVDAALDIVTELGPAARPIALDVVRAFAAADDAEGFGPALAALGTLPDAARPLLTKAAKRSAEHARAADAVLSATSGKTLPQKQRLAQIKRALASDDAEARASALHVSASMEAPALIPILLAHGAKLATAADDDGVVDDDLESELNSTREALQALGCPPEKLPHRPSRLQAFRGAVPSSTPRVRHGYAIAKFSIIASEAPAGIALGSVGIWDDTSGKLLFIVDGAEHLEVLPGGNEALTVRTEGNRGPAGAWHVERFALPSGKRLSSVAVRDYTYGWVSSISVAEQRNGLVATVHVGDEDWPARFRVQVGSGNEPDVIIVSKRKRATR